MVFGYDTMTSYLRASSEARKRLEDATERKRREARLNPEQSIDFSRETILAACKGDVAALPVLMVHNEWGAPSVDNRKRIHLARRTFESVVLSSQIPVRAGLWLRDDLQQFHFDIRPDQLGGDDARRGAIEGYRHTRPMISADIETGVRPADEG